MRVVRKNNWNALHRSVLEFEKSTEDLNLSLDIEEYWTDSKTLPWKLSKPEINYDLWECQKRNTISFAFELKLAKIRQLLYVVASAAMTKLFDLRTDVATIF